MFTTMYKEQTTTTTTTRKNKVLSFLCSFLLCVSNRISIMAAPKAEQRIPRRATCVRCYLAASAAVARASDSQALVADPRHQNSKQLLEIRYVLRKKLVLASFL